MKTNKRYIQHEHELEAVAAWNDVDKVIIATQLLPFSEQSSFVEVVSADFCQLTLD